MLLLILSLLNFYSPADSLAGRAGVSNVLHDSLKHLFAGETPRNILIIDEHIQQTSDSLFQLGKELEAEGELERSAELYTRSSGLIHHTDVDLLRRIGAVYAWMRKYAEARSWYERGREMANNEPEISYAIDELDRKRGIHFTSTIGGSEVDYAKNVRSAGVFLGQLDMLDAYGNYSYSDRLFYTNSTYSLDAYIFPSFSYYLRLGLRDKTYRYPHADITSPDISAYAHVPDFQLEVTYTDGRANSFSMEMEYFRPNFYWNQSLHAENFKISANLRRWIIQPIYFKAIFAILRDPEPDQFIIDNGTGSLSSFGYGRKGLFGGGVGYDAGRWSAEVKYLPDRDLDRSLAWSLFASVAHSWESFGIEYNYLYDRYFERGSRSFPFSTVHMITCSSQPFSMIDARGGIKVLSRETTDVIPFVTIRYKLGL